MLHLLLVTSDKYLERLNTVSLDLHQNYTATENKDLMFRFQNFMCQALCYKKTLSVSTSCFIFVIILVLFWNLHFKTR